MTGLIKFAHLTNDKNFKVRASHKRVAFLVYIIFKNGGRKYLTG